MATFTSFLVVVVASGYVRVVFEVLIWTVVVVFVIVVFIIARRY